MKAPKWLFELSNSFGKETKTGAAAALLNRIIADERDRSTLWASSERQARSKVAISGA